MPEAIHESTDARTGKTTRVVVPWTRESLTAVLAEQRWQREVAGITIDGIEVSTARGDERITWQALFLNASRDAKFTVRKKLASGFVPLTAAQILRFFRIGQTYISDCFTIEDQLQQSILNAKTDDDFERIAGLINLDSTWPGRVF